METIELQIPPHLRERRARAWFDTVFNPYLRGLEQEEYLLTLRNWTYRSRNNKLERIGNSERWVDFAYLDNLTDVRQSIPDFKMYEGSHNQLPNLLLELCLNLDGHIRSNAQFIKGIENSLSSLIKKMPEVTSLRNDHYYAKPEIIAANISEYFVNNIGSLPDNNVYAVFYNSYHSTLDSVLNEDAEIIKLRQDIDTLAEGIKKCVSEFYTYIESIRHEISVKLDVPFVA